MTETMRTQDRRGGAWRAFLLVSGVVLTLFGLVVLGYGLVGIGTGPGQALACLGLVLLVAGLGGLAREYAERAHDRHPPRPALAAAPTGEPALFLPRSRLRSQISSAALVGLAGAALLGALFAALAGSWGWALVLALVAAGLVWVATPGRAGAGAGGLWLSPERLAHVHDGVRWEVPWDDVAGVVPQEPMPVLVHPGRLPRIRRSAAAGRFRGRAAADDVLAVETRYLAGGAPLAAYAVGKAIVDPDYRAALGTPASLPPEPAA